jgi:imidazolonepropionase-like amidohydrolase
MAFGTNAGVSPYGINAKQFALMVKYGMTPMQAIQAATSSVADLLDIRMKWAQARKVCVYHRHLW